LGATGISGLYSSPIWKRLRAAQLAREPLCRYCAEIGALTPATVADHVVPHRGRVEVFMDPDNLQSLCKQCHDSVKQQEERSGRRRGCGVDGVPHGWGTDGG
jgi:5-methylcytosine-specific restriction enzyme A